MLIKLNLEMTGKHCIRNAFVSTEAKKSLHTTFFKPGRIYLNDLWPPCGILEPGSGSSGVLRKQICTNQNLPGPFA